MKHRKLLSLVLSAALTLGMAAPALAGDEPESWKSQLLERGYQVSCELKGLGEYPQIRALFVRHALEAAEDR